MDASVLNPIIFSQLISFSSCVLSHNLLFFEIPWSRHICPQAFILGLVSAPFSIPSSVLCSSSFFVVDLPHCLRSSILLILSYVIHGFFAFLSTFTTKSFVLPNAHFFMLFYYTSIFPLSHSVAPVFLLEYLAFSVFKHNFSKSHIDPSLEILFSFKIFKIFTASKFLSDIKVMLIILFNEKYLQSIIVVIYLWQHRQTREAKNIHYSCS